jgi:putative FmdB family regulatory protein
LPTYEYACKACGHRLEAVQKFTDHDLTECPDCGGDLRKIFGAPGIVLKGSGFYKTDTRAQDKRSSSDKNGSSSSDSSKSDTKAETSSSSDSGTKADSAKPSTGGDKPAKESKESKAASAPAT